MTMFFPDTDKAFFEHGEGAMAWVHIDKPENLALAVILPGDKTASILYVRHAEGNWARPGPKNGWNGDRERPTFKPSIQSDAWHGFITHGEFTQKSCPPGHCEIIEWAA